MFDRLFIDALDEKTLIEKAKTDQRYFSYLYDRYIDRVYRFVRRKVNNEQDVQDIVSQVFMTVAEKIDTYDITADHKFSTRLLGIAHNKTLHALRERYTHHDLSLEEMEISNHPSYEEDYAWLLANKDLYDTIITFVQGLSDRQSSLFFLKFVEGYKNKEIATMINIDEKTVSSTINVVIKKIKNEIT